MAHPYSTQARLEALLGSALVSALLDRNHDGTADSGVYAGSVERACNAIDARLRGLYTVPFAAITDPTPCDGVVSDAADYMTAALLFSTDNPDSSDAKYWQGQADAIIEKIRTGDYQLSAGKQTASATALAGIASTDLESAFGVDSDGNDNFYRY